MNVRSRRRRPGVLHNAVFWKVAFPLLLALSCVGLGTIGFREYYALNPHRAEISGGAIRPISVGHAILLAAGLPLLETTDLPEPGNVVPPTLQVARWLGVLIPPYAFLLIVFIAFRRAVQQLRVLAWGLSPGRGHAVVCGLGWKGSELAHDLREKGYRVVVIEKDRDNPFAGSLEGPGVVLFYADATAVDVLRKARAGAAEKLYVVTDSDEVNCRVVEQLTDLVAVGGKPVPCFVHVEDRRRRIFLEDTTRGTGLDVVCFNTYETTARRLLERRPVCRIGDGRADANVHVAIMGYTPMGKALLLQMLRSMHYPRARQRRITVIADHADACRAEFLRDFPCLDPAAFGGDPGLQELCRGLFPPVNFVPLPRSDGDLLDEGSPLLSQLSDGWATSVFVCLDDGMASVAYAWGLLPKLEALCAARGCAAQVCYYFNYPEDELGRSEARAFKADGPVPVVAFGNFLEECSADAVEGRPLDDLAREVDAHYATAYADDATRANLAAMSEAERRAFFDDRWNAATEWSRESNRQAADHIRVKLLCVGVRQEPGGAGPLAFDLAHVREKVADPDAKRMLAELEHRRWCAEKLLDGWRRLPDTHENTQAWQAGKKAFQAQKLHIDLVPYADLSAKDQEKDFSQIEGIPTFLENVREKAGGG